MAPVDEKFQSRYRRLRDCTYYLCVAWCIVIRKPDRPVLTHWGRVTYICVSDLTSIGSDNGLSPCRRQAIIRTNAGLLLIDHPGTNFSEILIEILTFSFKKMRLKVSSAKWRPFCLGLNVLITIVTWHYQFRCRNDNILLLQCTKKCHAGPTNDGHW